MEIRKCLELFTRPQRLQQFLYLVIIVVAALVLWQLILNGFHPNKPDPDLNMSSNLRREPFITTNLTRTARRNLSTASLNVSLQDIINYHPPLQRFVTMKDGRLNYKNITFYPPDCSSKLLVYVCNADRPCGGLADRQKGMISTFILAILTNRTFVVNNTVPCDVETHLPPSLYDWTKCRSKINMYPNDTLLINDFMLGWGSPFTFPSVFKQYNGSDLWKEAVVNVKVNSRIYRIMRENPQAKVVTPWLVSKPQEDLSKDVMELLFSYSDAIQFALHQYQERYFKQKYMVCVHFRIGAKGAERTYLDSRDISNMVSFMAAHILYIEKQCVVYIATDSATIKEKVKRVFPAAISLNNTPGHIDVEREKGSCKSTFTSILEQALLSKCDSILVTWSGFSRMAILLGGKANHIFFYHISNNEILFDNYTLHSLAENFGLS